MVERNRGEDQGKEKRVLGNQIGQQAAQTAPSRKNAGGKING